MTELETIERAKMYLDKMANGIDPITDKPAAETDMINNVRISRCLFFVSDILRRVLENGGVGSKYVKNAQRAPFSLTADQIAAFAYSQTPMQISELVKRINALIDTNAMLQIKTTTVTDWLAEAGMLERYYTPDNSERKRPTELGRAQGISTEIRNYESRYYEVVLYGQAAQHFILDNIDAVISSEAARRSRQGEPWSAAEEECLADLIRKGVPMAEISITLKRESSSVRAYAKKLGLIQSQKPQ